MCEHPHPSFLPDLILPDVVRTFIHPHDEEPALRRAAVLLERVRRDGGLRDAGFLELEAVVDAMRRAAAHSRAIHHSAIDRLASCMPHHSSDRTTPAAPLHVRGRNAISAAFSRS